MTGKKTLTAGLAVIIAGSIFYGAMPARAGGIELDEAAIVFRRHHDDHERYPEYDRGPRYDERRDAPPPPPPPPPHRPRRPGPGYRRGFAPEPHGHMPPPPPPPPPGRPRW